MTDQLKFFKKPDGNLEADFSLQGRSVGVEIIACERGYLVELKPLLLVGGGIVSVKTSAFPSIIEAKEAAELFVGLLKV